MDNEEPLFPEVDKVLWEKVFDLPGPEFKVFGLYPEGYYNAAKILIQGVVTNALMDTFEGVPALFLFRHYLELRLKLIMFHSRWLKDRHSTASDEEIRAVKNQHSLKVLWDEAKAVCRTKIEAGYWNCLDISFIDECVKAFEEVDSNGETFRYPVKQFKIATEIPVVSGHLSISYVALLRNMDHAKDILEAVDSYLVNTYGDIQEWKEEQNSWY
jgi:hypothetical protein